MGRTGHHIDGHRRELSVPRPLLAAAPLLLASLPAFALAATAVVPPAVALAAAAGCLVVAAFRAALSTRDRALLRRNADGLLRAGVNVHPESALLVWRAAELTSERNRRVLANTLASLARELRRPSRVSPVPLDRRAVRPHHALLVALAARVAQLDRPVAPRGMVLVEELITDGLAADLPAALERCVSALDEDADANEGIVVQFAARERGGVPAHSGHRNHAHSGGSR
jgi:hypothetical protein